MGQSASCGWCRRNRILTRAGDVVALDASAFEDFSLDDLRALSARAGAPGPRGDEEDDDWATDVVTVAPAREKQPLLAKPYRPKRREVY
ncbi:Myristylated tegument protein [Caprine alphaherpesvirus 1]|uniref:Myristylated tegument protein n=1 Tax=Caprine alphaherpesvirus 1 TaxID=39944 RepID=A0AAE6CZR0_9ALPH|nr:Myristylated tegument protein [Caprine alphaherpesvirus 1]QBM10890.1 Myristylated tegument protein [Caprine alphaherpesvirus 1]